MLCYFNKNVIELFIYWNTFIYFFIKSTNSIDLFHKTSYSKGSQTFASEY